MRRRGGCRRERGGRGARGRRRRTRTRGGAAMTLWRRRGWPSGAGTAGLRARADAAAEHSTGVSYGLELCGLDEGASGGEADEQSRVLVPA
jgi:hypothetical protein